MKKKVSAGLKGALIGFCYTLVSGFPVMADDTEIFFGGGTGSASSGVYPNVLFILDTSGSMRTEVGNTNKTRMQHMQDALNQILDSATGLNVGLMRFNDPGGPILYPVSHIDAEIGQATPSTAATTITSRIAASEDDAEEQSGSVNLNSARLEAVYVGGDTGTVSSQISIGGDDAEETISTGNVSQNGQTININNSQINAFRFNNTGIPQGATIASAVFSLTAKAGSTDAMTLRLFGELHNDATPFSNTSGDISGRSKTANFIDWTPETWAINQEYVSPDISSIVQEQVSQSGWKEDDLVILQTFESGAGERRVYSFNSSDTLAAKLNVSYQMGTPGQQTVGLRFRDIGIPQGATITSAVVEFTAAQSSSSPFVTGLTVQGLDADNTDAFTATSTNITGRTGTTATVNWKPDAWVDGDVVQTPDLKSVVQEIVDRSGWCGNNALGFRISGPDLVNRVAHSFDGNPEFAPVLRVTYDDSNVLPPGGCMNQTLVYRVNTSENDAEERSNGNVSLAGNVLNMVPDQTNGLRFSNVLIYQGATILEANLEYTAETTSTTSTTITLKGQAADNAQGFVGVSGNVSGRTTTSASVSWSPGDWTRNNTYVTPDLKTIIQEIVNRGGWQPGNALAIIQTASSGGRNAYTFNNQPADAALLKIKVRSGGVASGAKKTVRTQLKEIVNEFVPSGYTPIVDTMYEAANYYRGGNVLYGKSRGAQTTYGRVSHPDSYTGGTVYRASGCTDDNLNASACSSEAINGSPVYTSPISDACQTNHVVLLTDGEANHNNSISLVKSLTSSASCKPGSGGEACGRELAYWLANTDHANAIDGDQTVKTFTIGFNLDDGGQAGAVQFLKDVAENGGGNYYSASTASELANVFQNIIRSIMNTDTTFVSPGATVNQFNRLTHQNDIYFSVFKPATRPQWPGNLKRYELKGDPAIIVDAKDDPAVDPATGFFNANSLSFWSKKKDGNNVMLGGAAEQLSLIGRDVFTYTGTNNDLSHSSNALEETNLAITKTMLGIENETDTYRNDLLKWARGVDIKDWDEDGKTNEIRNELGAPLHSEAIIVTYGGTNGAQDNVAYFGTNEGYLHAIDTDDGSEVFAFVPQELLPNLNTFYVNAVATNLPYGLDGPITYWMKDVDGDHIVDAADGDHMYLYIGMRRGGQNYYALDVTDRNAPRLKWVLNSATTGFEELGQTWSRMMRSRVNINGTVKEVLIFAGGYDPDQDNKTTRSADAQGRAVFIVDADTGALLWSGGPDTNPKGVPTHSFADMNYSIASNMRVIDVNMDGLADQMYVGDMGGQLWRFDIKNGSAAADLVSGGVIADLALNASGSNDATNNRRFYYTPDVALMRNGTQQYLSISIGSGWRAHPLDMSIQDRFYSIRNYDVFNAPVTYTKIDETDLYNATANKIGETTGAEQATELATLWDSSQGWYIDLENAGEKVLAQSITINNQILFTTFEPVTNSSACSVGRGLGRLYVVSAFDASPTMDLNESGSDSEFTKDDRSKELARVGIPPKPTLLFPEGSNGTRAAPILCVGAECIKPPPFQDMKRTYWREDTNN